MKVAIQTISWGAHPPSIEGMLGEAKEAGYEAVELAQSPEVLGPPARLYEILQDLSLRLIGVSGGSLDEKMAFVEGMDSAEQAAILKVVRLGKARPNTVVRAPGEARPYIYVDHWEDQVARHALANGFVLAVHPHMFTPVQTAAEAESLLDKHAGLAFLPDTAHLTIAGEDVHRVIDRNYNRIAAVHLKDWRAEFGRAYQFYSQGFCELGDGDVALNGVVEYLKSRRFSGWLVVEQDASARPLESAQRSRKWLSSQHDM